MHRKIITWICTDEILHFAEMCTDEIVTCAESCICVFCAQCRFVISAFGKIFALQICAFCAQTVFLHICTFAHLHICTFAETCEHARNVFGLVRICENVLQKCAHLWNCVLSVFHRFSLFERFLQICRKSRNFRKCPENVPKKAHVFLSGTRVVPGPTRLTTQGGKSRQNMH